MKPIFYIISFFILLLSCQEEEKTTIPVNQENHQPKSVAILTFDLEELTPEGQAFISQWWDFKSLYQVFTSIAPPNLLQNNILQHSDSLSVFKRLYFRSPNTLANNMRVERDWRIGELANDTIFQLIKNEKENFSNFGWNEYLLKDIPYTFSIRAKAETFRNIMLKIIREKDKKIIAQQLIELPPSETKYLKEYTQTTFLEDNWLNIKMNISPAIEGDYSFSIHYSEKEEANNYVSFYRAEMLVPSKYRSELDKSSEKLLKNPNSVKSSFNSIYFWISLVDEEINQIWTKNNFPEKLNTPNIKARLKLFETYTKELKDNVKNNPNLTNKDVLASIRKLRHTFSEIIRQINNTQSDNLDHKMQELIDKFPPLENLENASDIPMP